MKRELRKTPLVLGDEFNNITGDKTNIYGVVSPYLTGDVSGITGNVSGLRGNVSGLRGNVSGLSGDVSELRGDATGIRGDATGIRGDLDFCCISDENRRKGISLSDLVGGGE